MVPGVFGDGGVGESVECGSRCVLGHNHVIRRNLRDALVLASEYGALNRGPRFPIS